jgi:tetratricopeptide (TPR) repeat protein
LKHDGNNVKAYFRRAQAQVATKEYDLAIEDYTKAKELDPALAKTVDKEITK